MTDIQPNKPLEGEIIEEKASAAKINTALQNLSPNLARKGNIFIGTLNLMATPAKTLIKPFHRHYHRKYHGKYKHAKKIFIFDLILIGAAIALLAIAFHFFLVKPHQTYLTINLKQTDKITVGQTQDFVFQISNTTNQPLSDLIVNFEFPNQFVLKEFPQNFNSDSSLLFIASLKEKQSLDLKFRGQLWGAIGEAPTVVLRTHFKESKNNSLVEQIDSLNLPLTKTPLRVEWTLPEKIMVGENFNLKINYRNDSGDKIAKAILAPTLPDDFEIIGSGLDLKDGRWVLEEIPAQTNGQINLTGFIRSLPRFGNATLSLQNFLEFRDGQFLQSSLLHYIQVKDNGLALETYLENEKKYLKANEEAVLKVSYQNKSEKNMAGLSFSLTLPGAVVEDQDTDLKIALAEIAPGKSGEIYFRFKLRPDIGTAVALEKNFSLALRPTAIFHFQDEPTKILRSFGPVLNLKISSSIKFHAKARYFSPEGDQLGRGPLPPRVGQLTKYWINWFITTTPNPLKKVILTGHLPPGVSWTGKTNVAEGEAVKYDPVSRHVSWQSDLVQATPGNHCPCQGISFELAVTPTADEIGQLITLLDSLQIQGIDEFTNEELTAITSSVTTDLTSDDMARGKGVVQQ